MSPTGTVQSLDMILEDVSAEINLSINALDQYSKAPDDPKTLEKCNQHLDKLRGVFTLLEMSGAIRLIADTKTLLSGLSERSEDTRRDVLETISLALARLMRYTEHVSNKPYDLPQLLLGSINHVRAANHLPQLGESVFFKYNSNLIRDDKDPTFIEQRIPAYHSRRHRQMYQMGLIEVLRQTNIGGGLKIMQKAVNKLDKDHLIYDAPNLWWIAQGMLDAFISQELNINKNRLKIFSRLDRQIKRAETNSAESSEDAKLELGLLEKEMLYLAWIGAGNSDLIDSVLSHYDLEKAPYSDKKIREEAEELKGPSASAFNSITEALLEEITAIEENMHLHKNSQHELTRLDDVLKQLTNLSNLLKVMQIDDQVIKIKVGLDLLQQAIDEKTNLNEKNTNILFIVLDGIRNALENSEFRQLTKGESDGSKLSSEEMKICDETHKRIKDLIAKFTDFVANGNDTSMLADIKPMLENIRSGFEQLQVKQVSSVIDGSVNFINQLTSSPPDQISQGSIELFADIIGSLEFYLETLKVTATPSKQILEFSESSLEQLLES
ncbi:MAG: hypothetical protein OEY19_07565 [Gammaproteobacteria bacterium]|nr:hypothetical protein [Gammaproteobacteria bacterium]MDH5630041.1 hypothetical protein [Gammaproteobacteria bacterium]